MGHWGHDMSCLGCEVNLSEHLADVALITLEDATGEDKTAALHRLLGLAWAQGRQDFASAMAASLLHGNAADTLRLDRLDRLGKREPGGWIFRKSTTGRGLRLHETTVTPNYPTVREAIDNGPVEGHWSQSKGWHAKALGNDSTVNRRG